MTILKFAGRTLAMVLGLLGAFVSLVVNLAYSGVNHLVDFSNGTSTQTHGGWGFILFIVGLIGALIPIAFPEVAAVLMLIAAIGMFFVVKGWAVIGSIFLILGAILAFLDRKSKKAQAA